LAVIAITSRCEIYSFTIPCMTAVTLILIAPCSLLLGAALQILVAPLCTARVKGILALLACLPAVLAVAGTVRSVQAGQSIDVNVLGWDGPLALILHVDALSVLFAFMGALLGALVLLYSIGYMAHDKCATRFFCLMQIFIGGFIALVYSANLFFFYLCWELVGLCSFSLVGFWYTNREAVHGARKVLLMTHIAGYGLLAGILVIYFRTGSALWTNPAVAHSFTTGVFLLMLVALVAKSVQVPLHTWIPEAMAAPTPVSALLHAACYVTAGVYLAARMHSFGVWPAAWGATLVWVGTITMALGVMYAMVQTDLKRMLAFSTVSQIGYMMMGLGIGTPLAITAGLFHCLNHGFFKGGLFLNAGAVQHAAGTRNMNELGGLAQRMPHTTLSWLIGVGSMAGIPLMSGFASKWMLYAAALQAGWAVPAMVAWGTSLGTVFLCAKATSSVFLGPLTEKTQDAHEAPPTMLWGMGFMATGSIVLGIAPQLAVNYLLNPILGALGMGAGVEVTWFGLFANAGSFSTTGGLVLALVSLVVGGVIYAIAYVARPATVTATAGGGAVLAGTAVGRGQIHGQRLLRNLSAELAHLLPLDQCGRLLSGRLARAAGGFSCSGHCGLVDGAARAGSGCGAGGGCAGRSTMDRACHCEHRRGAAFTPRAGAAGCSLHRGRRCIGSGCTCAREKPPSGDLDDSGRWGRSCRLGRCRSVAPSRAFGVGRAGDGGAGLAEREDTHPQADLSHSSCPLRFIAGCARPAAGTRTGRMGVGAADYQRLHQAGCHPALFLAAATGR
jgi:multicomponent Na+:H+ antiporter subunit A